MTILLRCRVRDDTQDPTTDTKFLQHLPQHSTRYRVESLKSTKQQYNLPAFPCCRVLTQYLAVVLGQRRGACICTVHHIQNCWILPPRMACGLIAPRTVALFRRQASPAEKHGVSSLFSFAAAMCIGFVLDLSNSRCEERCA